MARQWFGKLRAATRAVGLGACTASIVHGHGLLARVGLVGWEREDKAPWIRAWGHLMFPILGVRLRLVEGSAPPDGTYLVVANHRSPIDILIAMHLIGGCVLSHEGVADLPIMGDAARATDTIFVDRADPRSGFKAIRAIRRRLEQGQNVIVFPEGTTYPGDEVRPFKRGSFTAARGLAEVRVLPLGLAYPPGAEFFDETFPAHLTRVGSRTWTPVWAVIGEPHEVPRSAEDEEALRAAVQRLVDRAAAARDAAAR